MEGSLELLFHAHRRAAPTDIARNAVYLLNVYHLNGLFPHSLGSLFQVKLLGNRDNENVEILRRIGSPSCNKGLIYLNGVLTRKLCHVHSVNSLALCVEICVHLIFYLGTIKDTHCIGFGLSHICHSFHGLSY